MEGVKVSRIREGVSGGTTNPESLWKSQRETCYWRSFLKIYIWECKSNYHIMESEGAKTIPKLEIICHQVTLLVP